MKTKKNKKELNVNQLKKVTGGTDDKSMKAAADIVNSASDKLNI